MCGVDDPSHKVSVEDMVVSAIAKAMAPCPTHKEGEQMMDDRQTETSRKVKTTVGPVDSVSAGTSSAAVSGKVAEATGSVPSRTSLGTIEMDGLHTEVCIFISSLKSNNGIHSLSAYQGYPRRIQDG
jgi:hypothetical protein